MSKKRDIANLSFDSVASDINNDNDKNNEKESGLLEGIGRVPKDKTHVFKGFYLEIELANIIDRIADPKVAGKGAKSDLVNKILREAFSREGLL